MSNFIIFADFVNFLGPTPASFLFIIALFTDKTLTVAGIVLGSSEEKATTLTTTMTIQFEWPLSFQGRPIETGLYGLFFLNEAVPSLQWI